MVIDKQSFVTNLTYQPISSSWYCTLISVLLCHILCTYIWIFVLNILHIYLDWICSSLLDRILMYLQWIISLSRESLYTILLCFETILYITRNIHLLTQKKVCYLQFLLTSQHGLDVVMRQIWRDQFLFQLYIWACTLSQFPDGSWQNMMKPVSEEKTMHVGSRLSLFFGNFLFVIHC